MLNSSAAFGSLGGMPSVPKGAAYKQNAAGAANSLVSMESQSVRLSGITGESVRWYRKWIGRISLTLGLLSLFISAFVARKCTQLSFLMPRSGETVGMIKHPGEAERTTPFCPLEAAGLVLTLTGMYYIWVTQIRKHYEIMEAFQKYDSRGADMALGIQGLFTIMIILLMAGAIEVLEVVLAALLVFVVYAAYHNANFTNRLFFFYMDQEEGGLKTQRMEFLYVYDYYLAGFIFVLLWLLVVVHIIISTTSKKYETSLVFNIAVVAVTILNLMIPVAYYSHFRRTSNLKYKRDLVVFLEVIHAASLFILDVALMPFFQ